MTGHQCGEELKKYINIDTRVSCLGHIQRGGTPTGMDRVLASRLGGYAVELLMQNESAKAVGIKQNQLTCTPFDDIFSAKHNFDFKMYELANQLSI
ncbi:6-phosphofructokinase [Staphylococcus aureus]|nr:6-phosphofructokinase [Staphylococcus aureus]